MAKLELWYTEDQTENQRFSCRVTRTLHSEQTPFQKLDVFETAQWGRMLTLDGLVMTTDRDEFVYHEMITHVPLCTHPNPEYVAVIGGGDGGAIREILKHPGVKKATLIEIDERVIEASRRFFPAISSGLSDPRVEIRVEDGINHVAEVKGRYDVIIVDSTDPIGPAVGLFAKEFYQNVFAALREDGLFVAQTESPFYHADLIRNTFATVSGIFPVTRLYLATIPTYPSGLWSFTVGSKKYDPAVVNPDRKLPFATRYYTPELHRGAFALPQFVAELIKK
ncbi:MAG: polyamine aminopropyltransferase [Bacillota bacterium]|nr:polyamine aminopropyltransferase [Bacillota bacterium]